ncbi:hybrid sensor histidine kinase/response regulator [Pedobacter alpinus]|uniref:ATP-binding response regulator n=1 Tax=Pedobacter alpinus TaxID=1590643 RepID=UPI00360B3162
MEKAKEDADYNSLAKQRFLSNMSHEIRTPLQSIIGYSEIIKNNHNPQSAAVNAIYQSSSHLLYLINEILDYSRIASGKFNLKSEEFELKPVIDEVLLIMQPLAQEKSIQLLAQTNFEDNLWLKGDAFKLKQILYNLLGNAIKFTNEGFVKLHASLKPTANTTLLSINIEDTGIGISADRLNTIFDEFVHRNSIDDNNFNSSGLGLSIVKQLVELHNGQIDIESSPNNGSIFKLALNYSSYKIKIVPLLKTEDSPVYLSKNKTVWVIDDDHLILDLCDMILTQHQIPHKIFNKPKEVIECSIDENLHYIFMDIRMPEIDDLTLFPILKKRLPSVVKFYAITAQVLQTEQKEILKIGFDGIITKPSR